jgi:PPK2 family polyphosphate:nucleotide phosphotransferase
MKAHLLKKLTAEPGKKHSTADFDTSYTAEMTKPEAENALAGSIEKMRKLQNKLYADNRYSLLVIFQAMDAAGKDGTIRHVMAGVDPQGCRAVSFKQPSYEDLEHGFLWRIFRNLPEKGVIGIFNRSHYEEVIVTKVHPELVLRQRIVGVDTPKDVNADFWKMRYRQINDFERYLTENGVVILKFFLNVSHDEQHKRFRERLADEEANWKISLADYKESAFWDDYMDAYSDMLTHTSTDHAPWYVIPADHKWFMRWAVGEVICERMSRLHIEYPAMTDERKKELAEVMGIVNDYSSDK